MENGVYLFLAYTIIWIFLLGYVALLIRRQANLHREIESLKKTRNHEEPVR